MWLDPARTTPYAFYQYWVNTDDRDVGTYLRWFTTGTATRSRRSTREVAERPEAREAQRRLAFDVTARVHGEDAAREAERQGRAALIQDLASLSVDGPRGDAGAGAACRRGARAPRRRARRRDRVGAYPSKGEARRQMANGGIT